MNRGDWIWGLALSAITFLLVVPDSRQVFLQLTGDFPYAMGFIKFSVLASMGELLTIRLMKGRWIMPRGMGYKVVVWGLVGISIVLMFGLFSAGVAGAIRDGLLPVVPGFGGRVLVAFYTGALLNLTFAPVFMATHRITDLYIEMKMDGKNPTVLSVIGQVDWPGFMAFVLGKTIPFFWIPVQTVNFMLPPAYRVIVAAYLSIVLGLILAYARRK